MKAIHFFLNLATPGLFFMSCSNDDDSSATRTNTNPTSTLAPESYRFERNGSSSISFSGQKTRIAMAELFIEKLNDPSSTIESLSAMWNHQEAANDFEDQALNASGKNIGSKIAASNNFFGTNATGAARIRSDFDRWIQGLVTEVFPLWEQEAIKGSAGRLQEAGGGSYRYVNAQGLEYAQVIGKSMIGALMTDQILNHYLSPEILDEADNRTMNDKGTLASEKNYTVMEHKWDEAFGYLYGMSSDTASPETTLGQADSFLNKYLGKVSNDPDFKNFNQEIFNAFKLGRAAIVSKDYTLRDAQAAIIRDRVSQIIAIRAVHYLEQGRIALSEGTPDYASVFHELSEAYGFIYSLQFTRKSSENAPYFSRDQVMDILDGFSLGAGFWGINVNSLENTSKIIAAKFPFEPSQARD